MRFTVSSAFVLAATALHIGTSVALPNLRRNVEKYSAQQTQDFFKTKAPSHEGVCWSIDEWTKKGAVYPEKWIEHCREYLVKDLIKEEGKSSKGTSTSGKPGNGAKPPGAKLRRSFKEDLSDLE